MRRLAVAVLCVLALGACNKRSNDKHASSGSNGSGTSTTVTTAAPASTTTTIPSGPPATYQAAADGLYNAWKANDEPFAHNFARDTAIKKLFATPWKADVHYTESPCTPVGAQFNCKWTFTGGSMQMTVENWPGGGYVVDSVIFTTD